MNLGTKGQKSTPRPPKSLRSIINLKLKFEMISTLINCLGTSPRDKSKNSVGSSFNRSKVKIKFKGKFHPITGHEGPEGGTISVPLLLL